jgi:hypothetical protein
MSLRWLSQVKVSFIQYRSRYEKASQPGVRFCFLPRELHPFRIEQYKPTSWKRKDN